MAPNVSTMRNILMELRKICQHPYLSAPELEDLEAPEDEQQKHLVDGSGKLAFLKLLLPKLKQRGHRVLLFSQFKIALDRIEDFLYGEGYRFLRLDGDVQQAVRQKSMDAFNAPDSDYFIFLLTTRAGGVGINLATADTVIVYDPDFKPHMDLQAIARAHHYGQKKKVMVFKLMTKNSVEEQIILNGKKKMVLDHLVVQQMGKENEEGDIDNMLLHGAAALYEAGEDGIAASDIRYTSQNVDELIDKVQKDAEDEEVAIALRDPGVQAEANGADEPARVKESMSFGFAKIWEADKNRLQEIEDEEGKAEDQERYMQSILDNIELERKKKMLAGVDENAKARRRAVKNIGYAVRGDEGLSDNTPKKMKTGNGKAKNGKPHESSSDVDFALMGGTEESDDDSDDSGGAQEDLLSADPSYVGLSGIPKKAHKLAMKRQMQEAAAAAAVASNGTSNRNGDPSTSALPTITSSSSKPPALAMPSRVPKDSASLRKAEAKAARKAAKETSRTNRYGTTRKMIDENPNAIKPTVDETSYRSNDEKIIAGQQVLQWLYHSLRQLDMKSRLDLWALMALPEVSAEQRRKYYDTLGSKVDAEMVKRGGGRYFTMDQQLDVVIPLFEAGAPAVPEEVPVNPILDIPTAHSQTANVVGAGPVYDQHLPTLHASPQPPRRDLPEATRRELLQQMTGSSKSATSVPSVRQDASIPPPAASRRVSQARAPEKALTPPPEGLQPGELYCEHCRVHGHEVPTCEVLPSPATLEEYRDTILRSDEPEADKARGITKIDRLLRLHAIARMKAAQANGEGYYYSRQKTGKSSQSSDVLVVDEMEELAPPTKRPRVEPASSAVTPAKPHGRKQFHGCSVCRSPRGHPATQCPIVQAGPNSIMEAMKRFDPQDSMWQILQKLYDHSRQSNPTHSSAMSSQTCAFCRESCGRDIRSCVESRGGRRMLKDRIRVLEKSREGDFADQEFSREEGDSMINQLYDAYLLWPK